ncbi:MAG: DNA polymerase III subunit alpha [Xanthomonadales bacterium]|nr:DNA polymerase III subunit alpha [Xanthomonadales bacterium]
MSTAFVHLRIHSEYSLVDSTVRIGALVKAAAAAGMPALALTDESNLFGLVKFSKAAEAAGIQPIAGCDVWVREADRIGRKTLLVQDLDGYRRLCRWLSAAYRAGRDLQDRVVLEADWLLDDNRGLILLSGGHHGLLNEDLLHGRETAARASAERWAQAWPDRYYVELSRCGREHEESGWRLAADLAARLDLPAVASNDVRFLTPRDFSTHEARVAIHDGYALADRNRPRRYSEQQWLKPPEAMAELFAECPEVLQNTLALAQRCSFELPRGTYHLPRYPCADGQTEEAVLSEMAEQGLQERLREHGCAAGLAEQVYLDRLARELGVILKMGFAGYYLVVADFIGWGKRAGIPVGPGRGSGAGSLVAWATGITDLDPLRYDLLFERFLNPERVSMPDFDIDFCMDRRDEVIRYVGERYGAEKVSQIITHGSMAARAVVRDAGRVLGLPYGLVDRIAKLIPNRPLGTSLGDALGRTDKAQKESERISVELCQLYESDDEVRPLVDLALELEGLVRNAGKHAGGVVIAPDAITQYSPLHQEEPQDTPVTHFDMKDVEEIGLVKFDFLGLRTLTIIQWAVEAINARADRAGQPPLDIIQLPLDDAPTYQLLKRCETTAVFQLESRGMKELIGKLQPDCFEDIIALVALFRPGPLQSGMVDDFVDRKHGRQEVSYPHPLLEPILKPTYGVIVYQEQVMQIAQVLAGYSLGGADLLRRAMGKKKPEEMAKQREIFESGAADKGIDPALATGIFDLMEKFAEYGFNKSHSAAYALVSYQTAWLKAHYPAEFMAAVLSSDMDHTDKVVDLLRDCERAGIVVRRPNANESIWKFRAGSDGQIRYGLGAIKGVGLQVGEMIASRRAEGEPYTDLNDFLARLDLPRLNKRVLETLISSGALDELGPNRASLASFLPEALRAAEQRQRNSDAGQVDLFGAAKVAVEQPGCVEKAEWPLLSLLKGERDTLGWYLSGHPVDVHRRLLEGFISCPLGELERRIPARPRRDDPPLVLAGQIVAMRQRGDSSRYVAIEDGSGRLELAFHGETLAEFSPLLITDEIVVVEGQISIDRFTEQPQMKVRRAWSVAQASGQFARGLRIAINGSGPAIVAELKRVLTPYRGGPAHVRVVLDRDGGPVQFELPEHWRVAASTDLKELLEALPGVGPVEIHFPRSAV